MADAFPCHIHLPACLRIMDPHSWAQKRNTTITSHGNEVLLQDTKHLIQRLCYQRGSPCQNLAGNQTTRRPPNDRKKTLTAVVWSYLLFIRSGQNHIARHSERGKKTSQVEEKMGRQQQGMDRPGVRKVPEGSGELGKKWRKLVAKSSVVSKRPSRLRDRWWRWRRPASATNPSPPQAILSPFYGHSLLAKHFTSNVWNEVLHQCD